MKRIGLEIVGKDIWLWGYISDESMDGLLEGDLKAIKFYEEVEIWNDDYTDADMGMSDEYVYINPRNIIRFTDKN